MAVGENDPDKIIDFVRMLSPSVGAVNLEDIKQPECFKVLDTLREVCDIPVWHDDAQGTACITLAGLLVAIEPLIDMARTALNVSDSLLAGVVAAKRCGELDVSVYNRKEVVLE